MPRSHALAGTSSGYEERTTAMQDNPQTHGVYPATATTIICLASASQPPSSTVYTPFDPLSGVSAQRSLQSTHRLTVDQSQAEVVSTIAHVLNNTLFAFIKRRIHHTAIEYLSCNIMK